jgi:hypothetical protein
VGVAALLRLVLLRDPRLWYDEATTGLLGLAVLRGGLPVYFFGQPFMGALDGYLAAPLYAALGVSARTLELVPVLLSVAGLALTVRLAWDAFGPRAALFTAVLLALPPDYLLFWSHEARAHYPMTLLLGALALLLALRAPAARGGRATVLWALLGAVLGAALWTNFLSLVYVPAVAALVARRGLRPLAPRALAAVPAFALGGLPHWIYGLAHGTAWPDAGGAIGVEATLVHLGYLAATAWPIVAGVPAALRGTPAGVFLAGVLGAGYAGAALAALRPAAGRAAGGALTLVAVTTVAVAVGTQYGRGLDDNDPRYLLPLYTALPPLLGRALARARPARGRALAAALLAVHAASALGGSFRAPGALGGAPGDPARAPEATLAALERASLSRLYDSDPGGRILTFLSGERVILSNPYEEILPEYARAVDGAAAVGWRMPRRSPVLEANFVALGMRFAYRPLAGHGGAYAGFSLPAPPVRLLATAALRVTASAGTDTAGQMTDRAADTLWSTGRPQAGGEWILVDLGAVVPVALVRWLPGTYQEVPRGLRLEASTDGARWGTLIELPEYVGPLYWSAGAPRARVRSGRVELRLPPTPARYLRVTQTGEATRWAWTIRELYVYAAAGEATTAPPGPDAPTLARAVTAAGVRRLYADHGWASRVALADPGIRIPPANLLLDAYGWKGPAGLLLAPLRWEPGTGVLLEPADADVFEATAWTGGLAFARREIGGLALFVHAAPPAPGTPLPRDGLAVTAGREAARARLALDGDPRTRWATARPRAAGDWFRVDLPARPRVRGIRLMTTNPADLPSAITVEASPDGVRWDPVASARRPEPRYRWGGFTLLADRPTAVRLEFAPIAAAAIRLVLPGGDPVFDWSIHELEILAAN